MVRFTRCLLLALLGVLLLFPMPAGARLRAAGSQLDRAMRILVVIAHPDDEVLLAPLLAQRCVRGGARCSFIVMTRGESGVCVRAGGCEAGLGDVRAGEMARAAALFHASLSQWTFPDVLTGVDAAWSAYAGGRDLLVNRLSSAIALEQPDVILTFDPEHGTTGHEAHRVVASLVIDSGAPNVWMLETLAAFDGDRFVLSNAKAESSVLFANDDWELVVRDAEIHESQFTPAQLESLRTLDERQRRVWWLAR